MGIFNEQSNHSFARGIQGAPGVGFSQTADGNYDMLKRKLTNLGDGTDPNDAVTRKHLFILQYYNSLPLDVNATC